jgi:hypothetical protein
MGSSVAVGGAPIWRGVGPAGVGTWDSRTKELVKGGLAVLDSGLLAPNRACATCPSRQTNVTARDPTPTPASISHRELSHR